MKLITDRLPQISLPKITANAEVPVYMIHVDHDAEAYFFLFDFEQFVEASKRGVFVKPVLRVFAGRDDFDRAVFARQFREVFSNEFDVMRKELSKGSSVGGWLGWNFGLGGAALLLGGLVSTSLVAGGLCRFADWAADAASALVSRKIG